MSDLQKPVYLSEVRRIKVRNIVYNIPDRIPAAMGGAYVGQPYRPFVMYGCCVFLDEKGVGHWELSQNCTYLYS